MTETVDSTDAQLRDAVLEELSWTPGVDASELGVAAAGGAVALSGAVGSYPERLLAEEAVQRVYGVTAIDSDIVVHSTWRPADDLDIAREAAETLWDAVDVPDTVTVTVDHQVVHLSGQVTWRHQRDAADRAVRYIQGVNAVENVIVIRPRVPTVGMETAIVAAYSRHADLHGEDITVTTGANGLVILGGTVSSWSRLHAAEQVSWSAPGVTAVANHLQIQL